MTSAVSGVPRQCLGSAMCPCVPATPTIVKESDAREGSSTSGEASDIESQGRRRGHVSSSRATAFGPFATHYLRAAWMPPLPGACLPAPACLPVQGYTKDLYLASESAGKSSPPGPRGPIAAPRVLFDHDFFVGTSSSMAIAAKGVRIRPRAPPSSSARCPRCAPRKRTRP